MSHYHHLSMEERESLHEYLAQGMSISEAARRLGRSKSTVSRELKRNGYKTYSRYRPSKAMENYHKRRKRSRRHAILDDQEKAKTVLHLFADLQWSPEQISNRLKYEGGFAISYPTIYRAIHSGKMEVCKHRHNGHSFPLELKLRHRNRKRPKRPSHEGVKITNHISDRPKSSTNRSRFGHWEADVVLGKRRSSYLITLVDRKSRYLLVQKRETNNSQTVAEAMIAMLTPFSNRLRSITPDRGSVFAKHELVTQQLGVPFYFPDPYSPWQRGTNENTNGLLREYFPRWTSMDEHSDEYVRYIQDTLNMRPRKCLNWKSPYEVFFHTSLHLT